MAAENGHDDRAEFSEQDIREDVCGAIQQNLIATTGRECMRQDVREVVDDLEEIRGVRVDHWQTADRQHDDRDFIDLTIERSPSGSKMFETLTRAGFSPSAIAGNWSEGRVVLQWKR